MKNRRKSTRSSSGEGIMGIYEKLKKKRDEVKARDGSRRTTEAGSTKPMRVKRANPKTVPSRTGRGPQPELNVKAWAESIPLKQINAAIVTCVEELREEDPESPVAASCKEARAKALGVSQAKLVALRARKHRLGE